MKAKKHVICLTNIDQNDGYEYNLTIGKMYYVEQLHSVNFPEHDDLYMFFDDKEILTCCHKRQFIDAIKETRKLKLQQIDER